MDDTKIDKMTQEVHQQCRLQKNVFEYEYAKAQLHDTKLRLFLGTWLEWYMTLWRRADRTNRVHKVI